MSSAEAVRKIYKKLDMIGWLTPAPPDRLRRRYAGALGELACSHEFAALPQPGEPAAELVREVLNLRRQAAQLDTVGAVV